VFGAASALSEIANDNLVALEEVYRTIKSGQAEFICRTESSMKHEIYELFEKFPDGSSLWRDSVPGFEITCFRLQELAERSENLCYAIDLTTGRVLDFDSERNAYEFRARSKTECRSESKAT
jgi:hypothetical protein